MLVSRALAGDLGAFEVLVRRHQKKMLNIVHSVTGDYQEACEGVQDAFVAAYRHLKDFRADAKFSTWLTAITLNGARNRLKQIQSRRRRIPASIDDPPSRSDGPARDSPSPDPSALERLERQEIQRRVRSCIDTLEVDFREVLVLRDMQEFSYEEIAQTLRMRAGTVKSRLFRAREAVKDCLKRTMGGR